MVAADDEQEIHRDFEKQPWSFGLARQFPFPTWITGLIFGSALLALFLLLEFLSGRPNALLRGESPAAAGCAYLLGDYRIGIVGIIALAYSMTARYKLSEWTHEATNQLGNPAIKDAETLASSRWWGFIPGLFGMGLCLGTAIDISESNVEWTRDYWILPHILNWGWCIPFGWVAGRLIYSLFANSIIISRVARRIDVVDLDNTKPLEAAVRHGSRSALISLMFLGIISVHFVDPGLNVPTIIVLVSLFGIGAAISALPSAGVVQLYYEKRDAELRLLRREIADEERQLLEKDPDYEPGRIGDLVSVEQRLANWKVTVFRLSTVARLVLYVFIGFLSWIGAAAVSVFVEALLGT